jgi:hypothetical protein
VRRLVTVRETDATNRHASGPEVQLDGCDADGAARRRIDPGDRDPPDKLRQLVHRRGGATDQDDTEKQEEPTTSRAHESMRTASALPATLNVAPSKLQMPAIETPA